MLQEPLRGLRDGGHAEQHHYSRHSDSRLYKDPSVRHILHEGVTHDAREEDAEGDLELMQRRNETTSILCGYF